MADMVSAANATEMLRLIRQLVSLETLDAQARRYRRTYERDPYDATEMAKAHRIDQLRALLAGLFAGPNGTEQKMLDDLAFDWAIRTLQQELTDLEIPAGAEGGR